MDKKYVAVLQEFMKVGEGYEPIGKEKVFDTVEEAREAAGEYYIITNHLNEEVKNIGYS